MEFYLKREAINRVIFKQIIFQLVIVMLFLALFYNSLRGIPVYGNLHIYTTSMIVLVYIIIQVRKILIIKKDWNSYKVSLSEEGVCKSQFKKSDIMIIYDNIKLITEIPNSGLLIATYDQKKDIYIPVSLENYDILKIELMKKKPIVDSIGSGSGIKSEYMQFNIMKAAENNRGATAKSVAFKYLKWFCIIIGCFLILLVILGVAMLFYQ